MRLRTRQVLVGLGGAAALAVLSVASTHLGYREPFSPWDPAIGAGAALILLGGGLMVLPVVAGQLAGAWLNGWLTPIGGGAAPVVVSVIAPVLLGLAARRFLDPDPRAWSVRQVLLLIAGTLITGVAVTLALLPLGVPGLAGAPAAFRLGVGTATGCLIGLPGVAVLVLASHSRRWRLGERALSARAVEFLGHMALTLVVGAAAYVLHGPTGERFWSLYFIPLLWTAFRFETPEVVAGLSLMWLEGIGLAGVLRTPLSTVTNFDFFFFNFTATAYLLAAALRARREAERAKSEGDRRFRELVDTALEGIWILDNRLNTTYVNRRMAELMECDGDALRGRHALDMVSGGLPAMLSPAGRRADSTLHLQELQLRAKSGETKAALVAMNPIVREGRDEGTLLMVSDLTERVRAERAQRRSEALLAGAIRVTKDALVLFRREDGQTLDLNPAWEQLTGRPRTSLVGQSLFRLPEWESDAGSALQRLLSGDGPVREIEASLRQPAGNVRFVVAVVELVTVGDEEFGVAFIRDVTESRLIERQRQQAQKLEAVGMLAGGVAHDFNNILTVISASAALLSESIQPSDPRRADVDSIADAADRGAQLTRQLLAFSRDRPSAPPEPIDAAAAIGGLTSMLARLLGPEIRIDTDFGAQPPTILAAPGQLEQVIVNLAVNARDAMGRRGTLRIEVAGRSLTEPEFLPELGTTLAAGAWTVVSVRDTGAGIDPAIQARIFDPFFTTKADGQGTGLGLSTVYGIMRSVGGHIAVQSAIREGTTFVLYWPGATRQHLATTAAGEFKDS